MIANEKTVPPNSLLCDIVHCLEQLGEICNEIVEDIDTLLDSLYIEDLDDLVSNVLNNQVFDYAYKDSSEHLKICQFRKKLLETKQKFPTNKKIFLTFMKKIYLTTKIFFYPLAPLYNNRIKDNNNRNYTLS